MADRSTGGRTPRRWSVARKAAILAELGEQGATLSVVARRHAIAPSLLNRWRSTATDERRPALPRFGEVIADVIGPRDAVIGERRSDTLPNADCHGRGPPEYGDDDFRCGGRRWVHLMALVAADLIRPATVPCTSREEAPRLRRSYARPRCARACP
jgi:transposase-like protein